MLELEPKCRLLDLCIDKGRWWGARGSEETVLLFLAVNGESSQGTPYYKLVSLKLTKYLSQRGTISLSTFENAAKNERQFKLMVAVHAVLINLRCKESQ